ncbi:hypothetical protein HBH53_029800 [Parastagonospora nodorum]|nr:hypothetical protein HBH53_029800 [Parastagonospora nodorum]KAH4101357.1 hypothetical protein HBH46_139700 [Parastagonospora nodorum]KAH4225425.1 hypothetical protein HBI05_226610 [Parastagonospora nodorum]KAH4242376.1 hypothetical protein HBI06_017550 [Parastagonospora nodorum]KAH4921354.1 hypothetical protein HBH74_127190 [Parastagonospora nodorum]
MPLSAHKFLLYILPRNNLLWVLVRVLAFFRSFMMAPHRLGKLREVASHEGARDCDIDIVLVPGIGTSSADTWPFTSRAWLRNILPQAKCRARVLAFEYSCPVDENFSWEDLLMQGYQLLQELANARSTLDSGEGLVRPILFVCHSIGGVILKQALCIANEQLNHYEFLVNAVALIVFLSTPHSPSVKEDTLSHFMSVLKATTRKSIKIPSARIERESNILQGLTNRFEGIFFRTPVLSVYETIETRINDRVFRTRMQKLVDESTCTTHAPMEKTLGIGLDHMHMCHFDQSKVPESSELAAFIMNALDNATELITSRLKACEALATSEDKLRRLIDITVEFTYATMSSYSPTASEVAVKTFELPLHSTAHASNGSSTAGYEVITTTTAVESDRPQLRLPCVLLETSTPNLTFRGRDDVINVIGQELLPPKTKLVSSQNTGLRQFALCAMGGMGKTEIAQEFAIRYREEFDAIFWVQADEIAKINQSYQRISTELGLEKSSESHSEVVSRELVKGWLSNPWRDHTAGESFNPSSEVNWLIIFDNADDPMILTDYWPQGSGAVLITSRDPLTKTLFSARTSGIDLGPLSDEAGASLFLLLTGADAEEDGEQMARRNTQLLGGVPLAISQMAGIIRRQDLSLNEFHDLYTDAAEHLDLYDTRTGDASTRGYAHSISTVWAIEKLNPVSRKLLELITFLDADRIQEYLLIEASVLIFATEVNFKKSLYRDTRTELIQSSLVKRNKQKQELSVHRLVQDAVRAKMSASSAKNMFEVVVRLLWVNWPSGMPKPSRPPQYAQPKITDSRSKISRWPLCGQLYPHVLRVHHLFAAVPEPSTLAKLEFSAVLSDAGLYQMERGRTRGFDNFFDTAIAVCEPLVHPDRDCLLGNIYHTLGQVNYENNNVDESRDCMEKSLELQRKVCEEDGIVDERLAMAYAERGLTKMQHGLYEEGIADYEKDREIRESLGTYAPTSKEGNLASAYMALGKLDRADHILTEAITRRIELYGERDKESFRAGWLAYTLGRLRNLQGRYDESLAAHHQALSCFRDTIGDTHPKAALVRHKIAEHYDRLGQHENAINVINEALKIWSQDPDTYKAELARTTFLKANVLETLQKNQKAAVALKVACRMRQELTKDKRSPSSLETDDFEKLVVFWKR